MGLNHMGQPTQQGLRIYVAQEQPQEVDRISQMIFADSEALRVVSTALYPQTVLQQFLSASAAEADVLIISDTMGDAQGFAGLQAVKQVVQARPQLIVLVSTHSRDPQAHQAILSYGARDVLVQPFTMSELKGALNAIAMRDQQRMQAAAQTTSGEFGALPSLPASPVVRQTVITVYSPRGGSGKSSLATNIALAIQQNPTMQLRTVLVDFDVNWGSVSAMLGIKPTFTIKDLIHYADQIDATALERYLMTHETGLKVLLAPTAPTDESLVTEEVARMVFGMLRKSFDVIVVDTGQVLRDSTIVAMEEADKIIAVTRLDLPAIKHLREFSNVLDAMGTIHPDKIRMVINQVGRGNEDGISVQEAQEFLPFPLIAKIPWVPNFQSYINNGTPLVLEPSDHPYKTMIQQIVQNIMPLFTQALQGKRRLKAARGNPKAARPQPSGAGPAPTAMVPVMNQPPMPKPTRPPGLLGRLFRR